LVQWTLTDHLNTVRDIAKYNPQTGATTVVNHLAYDAFGRVTSESNPAVDSLFLFTARPFDADTGLQNNLNRWYDASVGRWLSEDPIGFAGGDGNLYRYVGNGVVTNTDAFGVRKTWDIVKCVSLVSAASVLAGTTSVVCAFAFVPGEAAGVGDVAEVAACVGSVAGLLSTTISGIDACLQAGCDNQVAYLRKIETNAKGIMAKVQAIGSIIGVR